MYQRLLSLLILSSGASVIVAGIGTAKASAMNLVTNGSFEAGGSQNLLVGVGSNAISDWEVTQDNVQQHTRFWNSLGSSPTDISNTFNSIDLDGDIGSAGAIAQTIDTVSGEVYHLSFHMGGNYFNFANLERQMEVFWGTQSLGIFTHELSAGETRGNFNWDPYKIQVVGTGSDQLKFVSLSGANAGWGAAVDLVSVEAVPVPEPGTVVGTVAALVLGALFKRQRS